MQVLFGVPVCVCQAMGDAHRPHTGQASAASWSWLLGSGPLWSSGGVLRRSRMSEAWPPALAGGYDKPSGVRTLRSPSRARTVPGPGLAHSHGPRRGAHPRMSSSNLWRPTWLLSKIKLHRGSYTYSCLNSSQGVLLCKFTAFSRFHFKPTHARQRVGPCHM